LTVVAELLTQLEAGHVGCRHDFDLVAGGLESGTNQRLMFPGEPAEENRHPITFRRGEWPLDRTVKVVRNGLRFLPRFETAALCVDASSNLFFDVLT
jgi:hypothetical protein